MNIPDKLYVVKQLMNCVKNATQKINEVDSIHE